MCRLRQITTNIEERLRANRKYKVALLEWQTKTIASFIAGTVRVEKGKRNPLAEAVDSISLDIEGKGKKQQEKKAVPPEVYVEQGSQVADNGAGSFERLMAGFR